MTTTQIINNNARTISIIKQNLIIDLKSKSKSKQAAVTEAPKMSYADHYDFAIANGMSIKNAITYANLHYNA